MDLKEFIVNVPDFPEPNIIFRDITPLLKNPDAFQYLVKIMSAAIEPDVDAIVAIESRGFLLGAALAMHSGTGLVLARKAGKLPRQTFRSVYNLEYGTDAIEIQVDDIKKGSKVVVIDDVLATGGTAHATGLLCKEMGAQISGFIFLIELLHLKGAQKLQAPHISFLTY